jgi:hypothetical protein
MEKASPATTQRIIDIPIRIRPEQIQKLRTVDSGARIPILDAHRFTEPLKRGDFRRAAAEMSSDPVRASAALDHAFVHDLRAVSALVASGQSDTALSQLAQMRRFYGPQAELNLWQGLAELSRGQIRRAAQVFGTGGRGRIRNPEAFLDEIHARLADPQISKSARESYENLSHYAEWQLHRGPRNSPRGEAKPNIENGSLGFAFRYVDPLHGGREVPPAQARQVFDLGLSFFRQDSPGLNNLDWYGSTNRAFAQAIELRLGTMIELPHGDIATLNPTKIIAPLESSSTSPSTHFSEFLRTSARTTNPYRSKNNSNECKDQEGECKKNGNTLLPGHGDTQKLQRLYLLVENTVKDEIIR